MGERVLAVSFDGKKGRNPQSFGNFFLLLSENTAWEIARKQGWDIVEVYSVSCAVQQVER
jgi:hypothetical protein